jgi:putative transposase
VTKMCQVLNVSRSGYYDWLARLSRPKSKRQARQEQLTEQIRQAHAASRRLYGSPRVAPPS